MKKKFYFWITGTNMTYTQEVYAINIEEAKELIYKINNIAVNKIAKNRIQVYEA